MARLIDADALYEEHTRLAYKGDYAFHITARAWLEKAPTVDAVPVVRCRECDIGMCYSDGSVQCEWSNGFYADDYCPRGKRKGGDE